MGKRNEAELLAPFECQNIPTEYKEYYKTKRQNLFASIQGFPEMWDYYMKLDELWLREFEDLKSARDQGRMFPLVLYFNAHAKIRVSIELALSGCMAEARSIMRNAIEFVAHAHAMIEDTSLQKVWLSKNGGKDNLEAFTKAFERNKKEGLFRGLDELHKSWGQLSETGSHANINALCDRFVSIESDKHLEFKLKYCGLDPRLWATSLFSLLLTCYTMERTFYVDYETRLKLDYVLVNRRAEFETKKERLRKTLITRYNITPPSSMPGI